MARIAVHVLTLLLWLGTSAAAQAPTPSPMWTIDANHSELTFSIRHIVSRVRGQFNRWSGTISGDLNDWEKAVVSVTIDASSIDTNNERRDADLKSANFFEAERFPTLTFTSTRVERVGDNVRLAGDLTMRGVTRAVVLEGKFVAATRDQRGRQRVGFEASTTIDRTAWGLNWNRALEVGGVLLGDEVRIEIVIAAVDQGA